jgi:ketosteroid isomerase-like protein
MVNNMASNNVSQLMQQFYAAFEKQDVDALRAVVTENWQDLPPAPTQTPGPDGVGPVFAMLSNAFDSLEVIVDDVLVDGDRVGVRARMSGIHVGPLLGVEGKQARFNIALHEFHKLRDGRVARTYHLEDWLAFFTQVEAFPGSPGIENPA